MTRQLAIFREYFLLRAPLPDPKSEKINHINLLIKQLALKPRSTVLVDHIAKVGYPTAMLLG